MCFSLTPDPPLVLTEGAAAAAAEEAAEEAKYAVAVARREATAAETDVFEVKAD